MSTVCNFTLVLLVSLYGSYTIDFLACMFCVSQLARIVPRSNIYM